MKQFAFPLSVKCADDDWRKCAAIFRAIGYDSVYVTPIGNFTDGFENGMIVMSIISNDAYHIDHFNPDLIRDIAAACTNDTWQEDELWVSARGKLSRVSGYAGFNVDPNGHRRPTLAEICAHHGYEIKGKDIVKKVETVSNCHKSYCEIALQLDEAKAEIKRLKSENAELKRKNDSFVSIGKVCGELTEVFNSSKDIRIKQLQSKVDELANKLQYNDNQYNDNLKSLCDKVVELSREKQELIVKINTLTAFNDTFHTSRPLEFHPTNLPNMFQTKPAEFSEREKKRLLRLAERIERLIK